MAHDQHDRRPADALVSFGVSGDLARKMTFVSLYQLKRRGLLDCPIGGAWGLASALAGTNASVTVTGQ